MKNDKEFTHIQTNVSVIEIYLLIHTLRSFEELIKIFIGNVVRLPIGTSV
jgi:hypothetical protein